MFALLFTFSHYKWESGREMGHGAHWQAVTGNVNEDFASMFNAGISGGRVVGRRQSSGWHGPTGAEKTELTSLQASELWQSQKC